MSLFPKSSTPLQAIPGGRTSAKDHPRRAVEHTKLELLLLRIAGADLNLLARPECSHDRDKFVVSGWLLVLAGVLASISMAFALHRVFHNFLVAMMFGVLYGFFSFNVDRLLVISLRKQKVQQSASIGQRVGRAVRSCISFAPRLLLAGVLALTVSKPLEIKLFQPEIDLQLKTDATRDRSAHAREATDAYPDIARLEAEKESLQKRMDEARKNRDEAYRATLDEAEGVSGHEKGLGPLYKAKTAFLETRAEELDALLSQGRSRLQEINSQLASLREARDRVIADVDDAQHEAYGLLASLHALDEIAEDPKAGRTLTIAITFVNMLFLIIDVTPILIKLLAPFSVYDAVLQSREMAAMAHCAGSGPKEPTSSFADALTRRMEEETAHASRLDKQVLEFEQELFARALAKLRSTREFGESEDAIGANILTRLSTRLGRISDLESN